MKVIISENSRIWDSSHPALEEFGSDVVRFRHQTPEELLEAAGDDRDILVLTDNDPASFIAFRFLADGFRSRRIHLFACLPFSYESARKRREIGEQLSDLSMVKSLCLVELDRYVRNADPEEKLDQLQARIRGQAMLLLMQAVPAIRTGTDEFNQFLYSEEKGSYERADLNRLQEQLPAKLFPGRTLPAVPSAEKQQEPDPYGKKETLKETAAESFSAQETSARAMPAVETSVREMPSVEISAMEVSAEKTSAGAMPAVEISAAKTGEGKAAAERYADEGTAAAMTAGAETGREDPAGMPETAEKKDSFRKAERKEKTGKKRRSLLDLFRKKEDRLR